VRTANLTGKFISKQFISIFIQFTPVLNYNAFLIMVKNCFNVIKPNIYYLKDKAERYWSLTNSELTFQGITTFGLNSSK